MNATTLAVGVCAVALLLLPSTSYAQSNEPEPAVAGPYTNDVVYVSVTGSNTPPFDTWAKAATNLSMEVISNSAPWGTILIGDGTFYLPEQIVVEHDLAIRSVRSWHHTTLFAAPGTRCMRVFATNCLVEGLTFRGGIAPYPDDYGAGIRIAGGMVRGCRFIENNSAQTGGGLLATDGAYILNCLMISNTASEGAGIAASNSVVRNCVMAYNGAGGFGGGAYLRNASSLINCTVVYNVATNGGGGVLFEVNNTYIRNSIVYHNESGLGSNYYYFGDEANFEYSCMSPSPTNSQDLIDAEPSFLDAPAGDFRLAIDSPCIDTGVNTDIAESDSDLGGRARLFNERVDMGAYEVVIEPASLAVTGNVVHMAWNVVPEALLQLQQSDDLVNPSGWTNVGNVITALQDTVLIDPPRSNANGRTYRLIWLRP